MKRIALFSLLLVGIVACSKKDAPSVASGPSLPQFDGLSLVKPRFSKGYLSSLEHQSQVDGGRVALQDRHLAHRLRLEESQITEIQLKISALGLELEGLQKQSDQFKSQLQDHTTEVLLEEKQMDDELTLLRGRWRIKDSEVKLLQSQIDNLSYHDLYFTNKKAELEQQLATLQNELGVIQKEFEAKRDALYGKREKSPTHTLNQQLENVNHNLATKKNELSRLNSQLVELKLQNTGTRNQLADLDSKRADRVLRPALAAKKLKIARAYMAGQPVSAAEIVDALMVQHALVYDAAKMNTLSNSVLDLAKQLDGFEIDQFKAKYEKLLADKSGKELIYNLDAVTVGHPVFDNRVQCYSGTQLFLMLNELHASPHKHKVVIFEKGHVLPGYVGIDGRSLVLKGIETTVSGRGVVNYGATSTLQGAIRVFDAHQFLLVELFKGDFDNFADVYQQMLSTVERYGFKTKNFEMLGDGNRSSSKALNASPLGFGSPSTPPGDQKRETVDEKDNGKFQPLPNEVRIVNHNPTIETPWKEETDPKQEDNKPNPEEPRATFHFATDDERLTHLSSAKFASCRIQNRELFIFVQSGFVQSGSSIHAFGPLPIILGTPRYRFKNPRSRGHTFNINPDGIKICESAFHADAVDIQCTTNRGTSFSFTAICDQKFFNERSSTAR